MNMIPIQVAQAIELRNEIIANCVAKKIIAVPLHYHYDPQNPILERKLFLNIYQIQYSVLMKFHLKLDHNDTTGLNMGKVGPHPTGSFETWVPVEYFNQMYEWFLQKRSPLTIFIHPLSAHELIDHTERVVFMGKSYTLNTQTLREIIPHFSSQYEHIKLGYANPNHS